MKKKGFIEYASGDHIFLTFYHKGLPTKIHTKLSHGSSEPGRDLLTEIRKELNLPSQKDFEDLIDCPMSLEKYTDLLREKKLIEG